MSAALTLAPESSATTPPRVWLVVGDKLGDNAQVDLIAEALGWPTERKELVFHERYRLGKPRFRPSLYHLDLHHSTPLTPPWPDIILTVGRRPSMVALWVRQQSGGRSRIVLLGRPKRYAEDFALIIGTGQYPLPAWPNVLQLDLPLMRANDAAVATARSQWQQRLAALPRPLTAVLVGGPTKPYRLDETAAAELLTKARQTAGAGTLYISTSRRTPAAVANYLERERPAGAGFYRWAPPPASDNPYLGLLAVADRFVVTGDSISMLLEVARQGKPLAVYPLPLQRGLWTHLRQWGAERLNPTTSATGRLLHRLGWLGIQRDLTRIHRYLMAAGLAGYLGDPVVIPSTRPVDELHRVVERIHTLWP